MIDWDNINNKVWMDKGKIVICSTLADIPPRLISCIEDNIVDIDGHEFIEWRHVEKDYKSVN